MASQDLHGFDCHHAVRPATICDDVTASRQFGKPSPELSERNRQGAPDVTRSVFVARAHVEHGHLAGSDSGDERASIDRLQGSPFLQEGPFRPLDLGQTRVGQLAQRVEQRRHPVVGEPTGDEYATFVPVDQARGPQHPQVL